jgi:hypothetical protein
MKPLPVRIHELPSINHTQKRGKTMRSGIPGRRIAPLVITATVLVVSVLLSPGNVRADTFASTNGVFGDDNLSCSLSPYPAIAVSSILNPPGQCTWINTGLNNFIAANPTNGSGPTGQSWSYSWAGVAAESNVEAGINILDYKPFVTTASSFTDGRGTNIAAGATGELGGCLINLSYTPTAANGAPVINNLHWIQALTGTWYGNPTGGGSPILDTPFNGGGSAYTSQSNLTPFYDSLGYAGTYAGGTNGFFVDRPFVSEAEYETNPVAAVQFQVVLASDTVTVSGGLTNNALTLYGGEWWGYNFSATDVPEPSTFALLGIGALSLLAWRRRRQPKA